MTPGTILVRVKTRGPGSVASIPDEQLRVRHVVLHKPTGRRIGGVFTEVERAGVDSKRVELTAKERGSWRRGNGGDLSSPYPRFAVSDTRNHVRRLREQESEALMLLDSEIMALQERIRHLRGERDRAVRQAFSRGHKVTQAELVKRAREAGDA